VQVYLDPRDRELLDTLSARLGMPRSEVIRSAVRRLASDTLAEGQPGAGIAALTGVLDAAADVPADLAERHDEYLYAGAAAESTKPARKQRVAEPRKKAKARRGR
jgi:metal-responsive CopG/Arc/MetJ family transcriptional regulator